MHVCVLTNTFSRSIFCCQMGAQSLCRPFWHAEASRWFVLIQLSTLKTHYNGIRKEGGCHEPIKVVQPLSSLFGSAETPWTTLRPAAVPDGLPVLRISHRSQPRHAQPAQRTRSGARASGRLGSSPFRSTYALMVCCEIYEGG